MQRFFTHIITSFPRMGKLVILALMLLCCASSYAQFFQQEKRIYLLDITESMVGEGDGQGNDIFARVKGQLKQAILQLDEPNIEVLIIPFSDKAYLSQAIHGHVANSDSLMRAIDHISVKGRSTNIIDAWSAGVEVMDKNKINYLFLLTDGKNNVGQVEKLYTLLSEWNSRKCNETCYGFYVTLGDNAIDKNICDITDRTDNLWQIDSMDVNIGFLRPIYPTALMVPFTRLTVNASANKPFTITFAPSRSKILRQDFLCKACVEIVNPAQNSCYRLGESIVFMRSNGQGLIPVNIDMRLSEPLNSIPCDTTIRLRFTMLDSNERFLSIQFVPEEIPVRMLNREPAIMNFSRNGSVRHPMAERVEDARIMTFDKGRPKRRKGKGLFNSSSVRKMTFTK